MATSGLQTGGFVLGLVGAAATIAATAMNNWSTKDRQGDVVTSVYTYKGLWRDCEVTSSGFTECRPLYGLLGYSGQFQAVRALMVVGSVMGVAAAAVSLFSLRCLKMGSVEDPTKAKMTLTAGIMFAIAGLCGITGASIYANQIVASFMMSAYNPNYGSMSQMGGMGGMGMSTATAYTFGPALFVAWIGSGVLLIGGVLKCVAFRGMQAENTPNYKAVMYRVPAQSRADERDERGERGERGEREQKYV